MQSESTIGAYDIFIGIFNVIIRSTSSVLISTTWIGHYTNSNVVACLNWKLSFDDKESFMGAVGGSLRFNNPHSGYSNTHQQVGTQERSEDINF